MPGAPSVIHSSSTQEVLDAARHRGLEAEI
jgi:hypothetical protein